MLNPARFAEKVRYAVRGVPHFFIFVRKVIYLKKITAKTADNYIYPTNKIIMKAKTIRILLPFAGFLLGCLFIIILVLNFAYRDAAPIIPPLFKTIHNILSYDDVRLAIMVFGFIGFTVGCIANLLIALLQKILNERSQITVDNKRMNLLNGRLSAGQYRYFFKIYHL